MPAGRHEKHEVHDMPALKASAVEKEEGHEMIRVFGFSCVSCS
jgi:hypothetical protein